MLCTTEQRTEFCYFGNLNSGKAHCLPCVQNCLGRLAKFDLFELTFKASNSIHFCKFMFLFYN